MTLVKSFMQQFHLTEMAHADKFADFEVYIYIKDQGHLPHFHFKNIQAETEGCICLKEPMYFSHSGKTETLSSKERKLLMEYLTSRSIRPPLTNYEYLCHRWNLSNPTNDQVPEHHPMPNYRHIAEYKETYGQ